VELLACHFYYHRLFGSFGSHAQPVADTESYENRQHDGRDYRPDYFQFVVVREIEGFTTVLLLVSPGENEQTDLGQYENDHGDDEGNLDQAVYAYTVVRRGITQ